MGRVAQCGADNCSGSLAPVFTKNDKGETEQNGFYCERCGVVFEDIETVNEVLVGVRPKGRIDQQNELLAQQERYEAKLNAFQQTFGVISGMVESDETKLGKAIREELEGVEVPA